MSTPTNLAADEVDYPDSDGRPIADNTLQFEWITTLAGNLAALYRDKPDVFVAGDLLWYPIQGDNKTRTGPDAMVVFGRPQGHRGSYQQWKEGGIAPQVVFEVLSPRIRVQELNRKFRFYERFGVEEYYQYDPDDIKLLGWRREGAILKDIPEMNGWVSPRLGIRFDLSGAGLKIIGPGGRPFETFVELMARVERLERVARLTAQLRALGIEPEA